MKISISNLRARATASTSGTVMGYVNPGVYNVKESKKANGYTWFEIEPDMWCALVSGVEYLEGHPQPRYNVTVKNVTGDIADKLVKAAKDLGVTAEKIKI